MATVFNIFDVLRSMREKVAALGNDLDAVSGIFGGQGVSPPAPNTAPGLAAAKKRSKLPVPWKQAIEAAFAKARKKAMDTPELAKVIGQEYGVAVDPREVGTQIYRLIREGSLKLEKVAGRPNLFALR